MISRWSNPLPREEYTATKVIICAYEDRWVPITFSSLAEAIRLYLVRREDPRYNWRGMYRGGAEYPQQFSDGMKGG